MKGIVTLGQIDPNKLKRFIFCERKAGFADRFIHMSLAIKAGLKHRVRVFVYWPINRECNDHFLNLFQEIKNVSFVDKELAGHLRCNPGLVTETSIERKEALTNPHHILQPKPEIIRSVEKYVSKHSIKESIGFHVRKTDFSAKARKNNIKFNYDLFHKVAEGSNEKIFLATDERSVKEEFVEKYGNRILCNAEFDDTKKGDLRQTTLKMAIIDLYILSYCKTFIGTHRDNGKLGSAFSRLAFRLNRINHKKKQDSFSTIIKRKIYRFIQDRGN